MTAGACLIAGCGDVGSRLAARLAARGEIVYGLRRSAAPLPDGVHAIRADLADAASLRDFPRDIDRLVYLPAPHARDEATYRDLFVHGLARLLAALPAPPRRLLFVSSSAVYGEHHGDWVDEDTPPAPLAFNGRVLREAEQRVDALPGAVCLRFSGLYGPGRTHLIEQVRSGRARTPPGPPTWTNRIHVEDAAAALEHVLDLPQPQRCYVVSDDTPAPLAQVHAWLAEGLGVAAPPVAAAATERSIGNKRLSNRRLRASGFALRHPDFRSGYADVLAALRRSTNA